MRRLVAFIASLLGRKQQATVDRWLVDRGGNVFLPTRRVVLKAKQP